MADLGPVVAAIIVTLAGVVGTAFSARRLRKLGLGDDQAKVNAGLKELAEVWEEKFNLVTADLTAERASHAVTRELLTDEQRAGARCRRELDDANSELRAMGRRRPGSRA